MEMNLQNPFDFAQESWMVLYFQYLFAGLVLHFP